MSLGTAPLAAFAHAPLLLLITACLMMQPLSTDFYLASLPGLATYFQVPVATVQLTLSLFVMGFGGAQLIVGPLSDRFGRRPILIGGLSLYAVASVLCGVAPSMDLLITARFLQSLGCCCAVVIARAIVRDAYLPEQGVRVIATSSSWLSIAPLAGPVLGSYLQVAFGWRAAFAALSAFSALLLILTIMRLPETNQHKNPHATDPRGLLANYRTVLGSAAFWQHALPGALSYGTIFSFISGSSIILIQVLHVPTAWFGYCFAFGVSGYLLGTIACRRLQSQIGTRATFRIGTALSLIAGAVFIIGVAAGASHWTLVLIAMFTAMGAHGINFPVAQSCSVSPFPKQAGTAAGLMGALNMSIAFVVGTIVGATHNGTLMPLAFIVCILGSLVFITARLLPAPAEVAQ